MKDEIKIVETLSAEEYEKQQEVEAKLSDIAKQADEHGMVKKLSFTRATKVTRQDVVAAFTNAFQMVGGVDRLALWADQNPGEFYKLFSKLMPPAASDLLDGNREFIVRHVLPYPNMEVGPKTVDGEFEEVKH